MLVSAGSASADNGKPSIAHQLAGDSPKDATNCGPHFCTTYYNHAATKVWAEDLPPLFGDIDAVCGALNFIKVPVLGQALAWACAQPGADLREIAHQADLARAANGCLQVEKKDGKIIGSGFTTHPDWCGGS